MKFFTVDLLRSKLYFVKDHPVSLSLPPSPRTLRKFTRAINIWPFLLSILFLIPGTINIVNVVVNHSSLHTWLLIYPDISQNLLASHDCILRILGKHISNFSINFDMHESHPGNFISTRNILCKILDIIQPTLMILVHVIFVNIIFFKFSLFLCL